MILEKNRTFLIISDKNQVLNEWLECVDEYVTASHEVGLETVTVTASHEVGLETVTVTASHEVGLKTVTRTM